MTAREFVGQAPIQPIAGEEPPAKLLVDPPLADALKTGRVVIQYYAQNLHIRRWLDASGEPLTINGLSPGKHKVRILLVNANHQPLDEGTVEFTVPG
ncbi:MAG TPA: DUF6130 family protein [Candidatus Acidoferrum sp.]|jgi:hypothetical protein|nr:DUF6130 family protein [Candidatus Acidoferrum sp.]